MRLRIPSELIERWRADLSRAGAREIGGVLFGEQLAEGDFRIVKASRQRSRRGTPTSFHRHGSGARKQILALHKKFGSDPQRFNYLGEWHSHPNALVWPSLQDEVTMYELLTDQGTSVNFLVLIILKLDDQKRVQIGAMTFLSSGHTIQCEIEIENDGATPKAARENEKEASK